MNNHWTQAEIRLTRYAWRLHDADKQARSQHVNLFVCVGLVLAILAIAVLT